MRLKGSKAVEVQDQCLMPCHGLLVVVSKPDSLDRNACPFSHMADIAWAESLNGIEPMGRFKVATTEEKTQRMNEVRGNNSESERNSELARPV